MKEEEEVKNRKEAAARRMAEAKARAEVSVQFSFSLLTIIDPSSSYLSKANEQNQNVYKADRIAQEKAKAEKKAKIETE